MLLLKTIKWKNFLSTGAAWTEIDLEKSMTTLIVGENGAGKSTLLDAISFLLYGRPFRNINIPTLVNSINQKHMIVEGTFDTGGKSYKIVRGLKPKIFEVYQGDKLLNQDDRNLDYQERLTKKILKMNFKTFSQIVILGSASFVPFMQLPAANRRAVVEDLLDIEVFSKMNTLNKKRLTENESNLSDTDYEIRLLNQRINLSLKHVEELEQNNADLISEKEGQIANLEKQRVEATTNVSALTERVAELTTLVADKDKTQKKYQKFNNYKVEFRTKIANLEKQKSFFHDTEKCPTCSQAIDKAFSESMITDFDSKIKETEDGTLLLNEKIAEVEAMIANFNETQGKINAYNLEINNHNLSINYIDTQIRNLRTEIKKLSETKHFDDKKEDVEALTQEKRDLEAKKTDLLEEQEMLKIAAMMLKDTGIKARIIKQYIPVINKLINKYLAAMDFFVHFELDENFKETIKSRYRDEFSYANFSEGEKARINLALLFTWRAVAKLRNSAATNLLIMDEVFDGSLDASGSEELMKVIEQFTVDTNTFIITHKTDSFLERFQNTLKFEKSKNFSRMAA